MDKLNGMEAELDAAARTLAGHFRHATDEQQRDKFRADLSEVVMRQFEVRQERRQLELDRLAKQLDELRGAIDKRTAARDSLIRERIGQMIGEEQDVGF